MNLQQPAARFLLGAILLIVVTVCDPFHPANDYGPCTFDRRNIFNSAGQMTNTLLGTAIDKTGNRVVQAALKFYF